MSILNGITRKIVSIAVDVHIVGLRATVKKFENKLAAARRHTDVCSAGYFEAQQMVKIAEKARADAQEAEDYADEQRYLVLSAAQEEAAEWGREI